MLHNGPKIWATTAATYGFEPNSGSYEWLVRVDRCSKGHAFVGLVTADCSIEKDSYVGVDRYGWGCIGTKALWHNKAKVAAEYGSGFVSGSVLCCRLDTNKGTLSYSLVDGGATGSSDWGLAFESLPKTRLFPAFSLHEKDDQITLLYCGKAGDNTAIAAPASRATSPMPSSPIPASDSQGEEGTLKMSPSSSALTVNSSAQQVLTESEYAAEKDFVVYSRQLYANITPLLDLAEEELRRCSAGSKGDSSAVASTDNLDSAISHPLIGVLLASLMASVSSVRYKISNVLHMSTLHVLPLFTLLTKRLSGLYDGIHALKKYETVVGAAGGRHNHKAEFAYKLCGSWVIRSSGITSLSMPFQEYVLHFDDLAAGEGEVQKELQPVTEEEESEQQSIPPADSVIVSKLSGSGAANASSHVTFTGTQYGTRVKILETWHTTSLSAVQGYSLIEGRVSLDGLHFSGRFKETKSSKMGSITGTRLSDSARVSGELVKNDPQFVKGTLCKTLLLCTTAVSKLASHLVVSNSGVASDLVEATAVPPVVAAVDPAEDTAMVTDSADASVPPAEPSSASDVALALRCVKSDLMSGGFSLNNTSLVTHLFDSLLGFLRPTVVSGGDKAQVFSHFPLIPFSEEGSSVSLNEGTKELVWWLSSVFPELESQIVSRLRDDRGAGASSFASDGGLAPSAGFSAEQQSESAFYRDLVACKEHNMSTLLDNTISLYAGQSALVKIGGEAMQNARRVVLAAMIKQTGCYQLCVHEHRLITSPAVGVNAADYRPNTVLLDVWRAVQRVIERTVRHKQETNSTYVAVCRTLCSKAELLLEIEPSRLSASVAESIALILSDTTPHSPRAAHISNTAAANGTEWWLSPDSGYTVAQDVATCVSNTIEFLINPLRSGSAVREILFQHAFNALLRSAGMKAMLLLLNKTSSAGLTAHQQLLPALSQLSLQSIPINHMLQSLREINGSKAGATKNYSELLSNLSPSLTAHYLDGLAGVSEVLLQSCRSRLPAPTPRRPPTATKP